MTGKPLGGRRMTALHSAIAAMSGCLLGACYLYSDLYLLAWVALVPWLLVLQTAPPAKAYWLGMLFGVSLFATGSGWIAPFVEAISRLAPWQGALVAGVYWLICSQAFAALGALLALSRQEMNWPYWLILPIFGTLVFELLPYIFPLHLGITQVDFALSLQATDVTGPAGLALVLLLVNAVIADAAGASNGRFHSSFSLSRGRKLTGVILVGWFGYGIHALGVWESGYAGWSDRISLGVVQSNAPAALDVPPPEPGFSYAWPPEMALYEQLAGQGAQLVIWPETRFKGYHSLAHVRAAFAASVRRYGAGLLLQDMQDLDGKTYNTAVHLDWAGAAQVYRKSRLIAFGETTPGEGVIPGMATLAQHVFGDFHTPLAAGDALPFFEDDDSAWIPLICYEVAFAPFVAEAVRRAPRSPQWLSVQSNDVWFAGTRQPLQHIAVSRMRAIENRLPLVHVLNNGPSVVIAPSGRLLFEAEPGERNAYLLQMAIPEQGHLTLFNRQPLLFPLAVILVALALLVAITLSPKVLSPSGR